MTAHPSPLYSISHIRELCEKYGIRPSKQYGQNYLVSPAPIETMVEVAALHPGETVVEVGPGFGVLTEALVQSSQHVLAFEIEKKLQPYWEEKQQTLNNLEIVWGNALTEIKKDPALLPEQYSVVANIPYQITSHLIRTFLEHERPPRQMVLMVQKEVAERVCADVGNMNMLALSVQLFATPKKVMTVKKGNFVPAPKVDSAILHISNIAQPTNAAAILSLAKALFATKRKQAWRSLAQYAGMSPDEAKQLLTDVCGNDKIRAEGITVPQWVELVTRIKDIG